jgi:hypothetical protein
MDFLDALINLVLFPRSTASVLVAVTAFFVANRFLGEGASLAIALVIGILALCALLFVWPLREKES